MRAKRELLRRSINAVAMKSHSGAPEFWGRFDIDCFSMHFAASFESYRSLFADRRFLLSLRNTAIVALSSALIVTALGALLGWIIVRSRSCARRVLAMLSFMSVGVPSVIVGLAVMLLYLSLPIGLYGPVGILVVAFSYRMATTTRLARAGLMQLHPELEEASAASGLVGVKPC